VVRLELPAGATAAMIRAVGLTLIPVLACASIDGADQGQSSPDGDASSGSGATHTGGRASGGGGGSMASGGSGGALHPVEDPDLPCDCTRPCPLNCDLREEVKPISSHFDWSCGDRRGDDFLLECYSPFSQYALALFRRCNYIGVEFYLGYDRRNYIDWYDALTHELVGWEVTDITASPTRTCYGAMPPPYQECEGPRCSMYCTTPGRSCSLSDLVPGDASTGDLDAAMSGGD
jgi:hypothetical protein